MFVLSRLWLFSSPAGMCCGVPARWDTCVRAASSLCKNGTLSPGQGQRHVNYAASLCTRARIRRNVEIERFPTNNFGMRKMMIKDALSLTRATQPARDLVHCDSVRISSLGLFRARSTIYKRKEYQRSTRSRRKFGQILETPVFRNSNRVITDVVFTSLGFS